MDNKFVIDSLFVFFIEKAELSNNFCRAIFTTTTKKFATSYLKRLSYVQISNENVIKIINNLDPNTADDDDTISIRITSNNIPLSLCPAQKHLELGLDSKLTFIEHIKHILSKVNKSIGLLHKFQPVLPISSLLTICKTFIHSHFDCADVVYDQSYMSTFHEKLKLIQKNAALRVTGAIQGSSSEKLCQEFGLESLQSKRWFRKLYQFYKIFKNKPTQYVFNTVPTKLRVHNTRSCDNISLLKIKHSYLRKSFFPSSIAQWDKFSRKVRNSENIRFF